MGKRRKREGSERRKEGKGGKEERREEGGGREEKNEDYQVYGDCFSLKFTYLDIHRVVTMHNNSIHGNPSAQDHDIPLSRPVENSNK